MAATQIDEVYFFTREGYRGYSCLFIKAIDLDEINQ